MCGACKIILDDAVAEVFDEADCKVEAQLARSCARLVDHFDDATQNRMSRLDLWLLRQPDVKLAAPDWRRRLFEIMDDFAGGELLERGAQTC